MNKKYFTEKKGELTTQQIIGLIILIVSFGVILFLLFRLDLGQTTNKEICHNSVLLKAQSKIGGTLDCRTNYVCISGEKDCEGFSSDYTIEISGNSEEEIRNATMKAIADEMADCWWMFGEGKVDYVRKGVLNENYCSICSVIHFDEKLKEKINDINYDEFYDYLSQTKKGSSENYLGYLYRISNSENLGQNYLKNILSLDKEYVILTGLGKKGYLSQVFGFTVPGLAWNYFNSDEDEITINNIPVLIVERNSPVFEDLKCDTFLTKA